MSQQLLFVLFIGYFLAYFIYVWSCRKWFGYTKHLKQYISKHQHHKKSAHNFHISKCTGHKNTRNQAPPFAIDLNENPIAHTFGVHTKSPFETIDNNTKNSVSIVHIHYSCEMAIFSYFFAQPLQVFPGSFLIFFWISLMYNRTRASFSISKANLL